MRAGILKNLQNLNLSQIIFTSFEDTVTKLKSLPALISIHIEITDESQVDVLLEGLDKIQVLNGQRIDNDDDDLEDHMLNSLPTPQGTIVGSNEPASGS